jgi:hypothetical protein
MYFIRLDIFEYHGVVNVLHHFNDLPMMVVTGVDVIITIFCNFLRKNRVFLNSQSIKVFEMYEMYYFLNITCLTILTNGLDGS